jgi:hypothetical protein
LLHRYARGLAPPAQPMRRSALKTTVTFAGELRSLRADPAPAIL